MQVEPGFTFVDPATFRKLSSSSFKLSPTTSFKSPAISLMEESSPYIPTTSHSVTPQLLLSKLLFSETQQNSSLIEILSFIKPNIKHIASIVRGLFTKNKQLLALLNNNFNDGEADKDIFKSFLNEFILWLEDYSKLIEKFNNIISNIDDLDRDISGDKFDKFINPVLNVDNYIELLSDSCQFLRNPFIIEKVNSFKTTLLQVTEKFHHDLNLKHLNNITFNNIKSFNGNRSVSSCFNLNQIVDRTKMEVFYINNNTNQLIELCLLDLLENCDESDYNALAILSIEENHRSLLYPPFRINEFSCNFSNSSIILTPIHYTHAHPDSSITIHGPQTSLSTLKLWYDKLTHIFPYTLKNDPINSGFEYNSPPQMNGLGIMVSNVSCNSLTLQKSTPTKSSYHHRPTNSDASSVHGNPVITLRRKSNASIVSATSSQLQHTIKSSKSAVDISRLIPDANIVEAPQRSLLPHTDLERHLSLQAEVDSFDYGISSESIIGSYSDNLDSDTIENHSVVETEEVDVEEEEESSKSSESSVIDEESSKTTRSTLLAEKLSTSPPHNVSIHQKFQSVPDLAPPASIYKLSTGSSIDITKFGSSHQPTFSVRNLSEIANGSTSSVNTVPGKKSKRKLFRFFKKSSSSSSSAAAAETVKPAPSDTKNTKKLTIDTTSVFESKNSLNSLTLSENRSISQLPSPFALPSSTSMYFFKQENNSNSTTDQNPSLVIPQELKDKINEAEDFYISETSPKAMKISKWKQKYGKWELLTVGDKLFMKIVIDYETSQGWIIAFEEEEEYDTPILIIDLNDCTVRQSTSLDVQITGKNSVTKEQLITIFRCKSGLLNEVVLKVNQAILSLTKGHEASLKSSSSNGTIVSPMNSARPSKSSTLSSISTYGSFSQAKFYSSELARQTRDLSSNSLNEDQLLKNMTIRLQKLQGDYEQVNDPTAWNVLSMYNLSIDKIKDTQEKLKLSLQNIQSNSEQDFEWLIEIDEKHNIFEQIGKAGLLVKADNGEHFMIECKGRREFATLQQIIKDN